jgi:Na+-driven multidrug efflux pump
MQPLVSQSYGARNAKNIHRLLKYGVVSVILMSAIMYAILFLWTDPIAAVFNSENSAQLQTIAVEGVQLYFTALPFMGFNIIMAIFFAAINRPIPAQAVSLMRGLFVLVPAVFIMAKLWNMPGVWLSFTVTEFLVTVAAVIMMGVPKMKK